MALENIWWLVFGIFIGLAGGYFGTRFWMQKQMEKNPPVNEIVVTEMMKQMGRMPSKKQVAAVMRTMQSQNTTATKGPNAFDKLTAKFSKKK
ncbi:MAG: YneF family protein [Culicoidibacterales bacterium]